MLTQTIDTLTSERTLTINKDYWSLQAERIFIPELLQMIDLLHELFSDGRNQLLQQRITDFKANFKNPQSALDQSPLIATSTFVAEVPAVLEKLKTQIAIAPDATHLLIKLFTNLESALAVDAVVFDFEDAIKPTLSNYLKATLNIYDIAQGHPRYTQKSNPFLFNNIENSVQPPQLIYRVRGLHQSERALIFGNEYGSSSIIDLVLAFYVQVKFLQPKNKQLFISIPKINSAVEVYWWNAVIDELEDLFGLENGTIKIFLEISTSRAVVELEELVETSKNRIIGIAADLRSKFFDDVRYHIKRTPSILPERKDVSIDQPAINQMINKIISVTQKHNLFSVALNSINAYGNLNAEANDASMQHYQKELQDLVKNNFDTIQITHPSFAENVRAAFGDHKIKNDNSEFNSSLLLNYHQSKITLKGLRKNLRACIEFIHAWDHGISAAFFDNRYEDVTAFDCMRAQIRQWVTNFAITEEGEKINSRLITMYLLEELDHLKTHIEIEFDGNPTSEMRTILNTYTQATLKLEQMLLNETIPVYFNSGASSY